MQYKNHWSAVLRIELPDEYVFMGDKENIGSERKLANVQKGDYE